MHLTVMLISLSSLFYMPGTIGGAFIVDYLGPKWTMVLKFIEIPE